MEDIINRLTILETRFNERWNAHDKRSEEQWAMIRRELSELKTTMSKFVEPCVEINSLKDTIKNLWMFVSGIIITLIVSVVRQFIK